VEGSFVIARISGAQRGHSVALLIRQPALMFTAVLNDASQITMLVALDCHVSPHVYRNNPIFQASSISDARRFNRCASLPLLVTVIVLTLILKQKVSPSVLGGAMNLYRDRSRQPMDFPFSPCV